ncbi:hypothetical protein AB0K45_11815 [Micrococcus luteus]
MRPLTVIDQELRLIAVMREAAREANEKPSMVGVNDLLDERFRATSNLS